MPSRVKKTIRRTTKLVRTEVARRSGVLPDFLIIGAQKCGTTSLYEYLIRHPNIYSATTKEVGYFDRYYPRGLGWYRSHFPLYVQKYYATAIRKEPFLTGEASTGYILNPYALKRISEVLPKAKLLLVLRDPVERAYSHYQHTFGDSKEPLPFELAIEKESDRLGEAWKKMLEDENYYNFDIALHAYLRTGIYYDQVKVLLNLFPKERLFVTTTEELGANIQRVLNQVFEFLEVPLFHSRKFERFNTRSYSKMEPRLRRKLSEYFRPHNIKLYELLGRDFGWSVWGE